MVGNDLASGVVIYTERGDIVEELTACAEMEVSTVTIDPRGKLIVLSAQATEDGDDGTLTLARIVDGRATHLAVLPDSFIDRPLQTAWPRGVDLMFVYHRVDDREARLVTFRPAAPGVELVNSVAAPLHVVLAQDAQAHRLVCLSDGARRVELTALGMDSWSGRP